MAQILTVNDCIELTIAEEMRRDPTIFYYGWQKLGRHQQLVEEFTFERICQSGICENQEAGAGIGAALAGARPIVYIGMTDWAFDGWEQIVSQAARMRFKLAGKADVPVVFWLTYGNIFNSVHHSSCAHNWIANSAGLFVAIPSTAADARGLWRTALRDAKDPVAILIDGRITGIKGPVPDDNYTIPFGKADIPRTGNDVTIAAIGYNVHQALQAAETLAKEGISAEVWDPRTLTPFDRVSLIKSVRKTGAMVVVDLAPKSFGTTGEFIATVTDEIFPVPPMARVAGMDAPIGASPVLRDYVIPSEKKIINAVKAVLDRKRAVVGSK